MPSPLSTLTSRFDALTRELEVPGASLAVWRDGEQLEHATGVINKRTRVDATPDAIFQIGSITKLLTATLTMQLVEEGRIRLEDRIADRLPGFATADLASRDVTIAQLLTHTSGIDG